MTDTTQHDADEMYSEQIAGRLFPDPLYVAAAWLAEIVNSPHPPDPPASILGLRCRA